ncbi:MAG TPA: ABC transporter substrate-binding protein [Stellaceae bacterium]|nr:ABC transporter substrate-binding protein [Stellaceae bacterium]
MVTRRELLWGGAAAMLLPIMPAARAAALKPVKCIIPIPNFDESFAPFAVAKYVGYFKEEGLDVTFITVRGSGEAAIQVSAGNADVAAASPVDEVIGLQPGKDLDVKYFYDLYYRNIWSISVPPGSPIHSVAELKGKKLGVIGMGSAGVAFGRAYLNAAGLDPAHDVTFIAVGVGAQAINAVRQNFVDALVYPENLLNKIKVLGLAMVPLPVNEKLANLPDTGLFSRRETIRDHPQILIGVARAVDKGYYFNMANPAAAVKITWKLYPEAEPKNMPPDKALAGGIFVNQERMKIWRSPKTGPGQDGMFLAPQWRDFIEFMLQQKLLAQPVPLDRIYTNALIPEINKFDRDKVRAEAKSFDISRLE